MVEAYVKFQQALDEEYQIIIKNYYLDTRLSFILAVLNLKQRMSMVGSIGGIFEADRNGDALCLSDNSTVALPLIPHYDLIAEYLSKPTQSGQYSISAAGGRLHSNAVLHCLQLLNNSESPPLIPYERNIDGKIEHHRSYDQRDGKILSQWAQTAPKTNHGGGWKDMIVTEIDTCSYLESSQIRYEDDPSIPRDPNVVSMWNYAHSKSRMDFEQRYLLGNVLYFFPRAGRSDKLLHICETKLIPKPIISPEYRELILCAMDAYVKHWTDGGSGSLEVDEWAYPHPLVKVKVSLFTNGEKEEIIKLRAQSRT